MHRSMIWVCLAACVFARTAGPAWAQSAATQPTAQEIKAVDAEMEKLLQRAIVARLKAERQLLAEEIAAKANNPRDLVKAREILAEPSPDTPEAFVEHAYRALAQVDAEFAKAHALFVARQYDKAASAAAMLVNEQDTSIEAARTLLYAQAIEHAGDHQEAADAYAWLVRYMPDRISFAMQSLRGLADMYHHDKRSLGEHYVYSWLVKSYGASMSQTEFTDAMLRKLDLERTWADPLGKAGDLMNSVHSQMVKDDYGDKTQARQKEIVAILDEMINVDNLPDLENRIRKHPTNPVPPDGRPPFEWTHPLARTDPMFDITKTPNKPADDSELRIGAVATPEDLNDLPAMKESKDWAKLPPEKRRQLENLHHRLISERYRDIIRDTRRAVAEGR